MKPVGIGIVGYGGFGRFLHRAWGELDSVNVAAVSDTDSTRNPGQVRFHSEWRDLLIDPDVQLVAIATPPSSHAAIACAALESGRHVVVEKPISTTLDDARRIAAARAQTGLVATVDYMLRFNPVVETIRSWCDNGGFGGLNRVVVENYAQDETLPETHWFWDESVSGGILVEHAVHFFDVVQWCVGSRPSEVQGFCVRRHTELTDRMMATVAYDDGLLATHYHAFSRPNCFERTSMRFVFDLAQIETEGWIPLSGKVTALVNPDTMHLLDMLPGFRNVESHRIDKENTPAVGEAGGGRSGPRDANRIVCSGGRPYDVGALVCGEFAMTESKSEAYASALRLLLEDVVAKIHDPDHCLRVTLEDGILSLEIALLATESGRRRSSSR